MDDEELSETHLAELGAVLDALERELVAAMARQDGTPEARHREVRLGLVKAARTAIATGEYGICRRCEEPIGLLRLRTRPEAALCVRCQGER